MKPVNRCLHAVLLMVCLAVASAQQATGSTNVGGFSISGSLRSRMESWDWFTGNADHDYTFLGSILRLSVGQRHQKFDWQIEFALLFLLGLPSDAIAPGVQGQLGFGATYYAANNRATNAATIFPKQFFSISRISGA